MTLRTSILFLALAALFACGCCTAPESDSDPETTTTDTIAPVTKTCESSPMAPVIAAPEDIGGFVAAMLPPFDVDTTCEVVTARFYLNDDLAPCEPPDSLDLVSVIVDVNNPGPPVIGSHAVVGLPSPSMWVETEEPNVYDVSWPVQTTHVAGRQPLVGVVVQEHLCPMTRPICGGRTALRYRMASGWDSLGTGLHFGIGDCHQTSP